MESATTWSPQIVSGIRKIEVDSVNCPRNPQIASGIRINLLAESTYICGIRKQLRNPEQLPILSRCGVHNKNNVPSKFTLQVFAQGISMKKFETLLVESIYNLKHV